MKRKSQMTSALDQLRNEDPKKRLHAVSFVKQIAAAIGPTRVRNEFIAFLNEFVDDEEDIIQALLQELKDFSNYLGGPEHEKALLPLLTSFCKIDQRAIAEKSLNIMDGILAKNPQLILDTIKQLNKPQMTVSKQCVTKLIAFNVKKIPKYQQQVLEIYNTIVFHENPAIRKLGAKYLKELLNNATNKQAIGKMLEYICNDVDDLPKLFALDALIDYYEVNFNLTLNKLKNLLSVQSWRINLKICELMHVISKKFSKNHFKIVIEPNFYRFFTSSQPEIRAASCNGLEAYTKNLSEQQIKLKLLPVLKNLATDNCSFVKIALSQNILKLAPYLLKDQMKEIIIPIALDFMKANQFQLGIGIMNDFEVLSEYLTERDFEEKILSKITVHFQSDNWRLKVKAIDLMSKILTNPTFLNSKTVNTIIELASDRVDAVRKKVIDLIIQIIKKQGPDWSDTHIIPLIVRFKENVSYLHRQTVILIIQKSLKLVSKTTLRQVYKTIINQCMNDKIVNVRVLALNTLKQYLEVASSEGIFTDSVNKLKQDKDFQVKQLARTIKC